jgi:hypothetical protein
MSSKYNCPEHHSHDTTLDLQPSLLPGLGRRRRCEIFMYEIYRIELTLAFTVKAYKSIQKQFKIPSKTLLHISPFQKRIGKVLSLFPPKIN